MEFLVPIIIVAIIIFLIYKFKHSKKYDKIREKIQKRYKEAISQREQCKFCGTQLQPGAPFCEKCGHSIKDQRN